MGNTIDTSAYDPELPGLEDGWEQWEAAEKWKMQDMAALKGLLEEMGKLKGKPEIALMLFETQGANDVSNLQSDNLGLAAAQSTMMTAVQSTESDIQNLLNKGANMTAPDAATLVKDMNDLKSEIAKIGTLEDTSVSPPSPAFSPDFIKSLQDDVTSLGTALGMKWGDQATDASQVFTNWTTWNAAVNKGTDCTKEQNSINAVFSDAGTLKGAASSQLATVQMLLQQISGKIQQMLAEWKSMMTNWQQEVSAINQRPAS